MAKEKSPTKGMKCYKKLGGGSMRFPNRIIKSGQNFWIDPEELPDAFKDLVEETAEDKTAVIVPRKFVVEENDEPINTENKYKIEEALDDDGIPMKKGKKKLYNIVSTEDGDAMNEEPMLKGKANEFLESLN